MAHGDLVLAKGQKMYQPTSAALYIRVWIQDWVFGNPTIRVYDIRYGNCIHLILSPPPISFWGSVAIVFTGETLTKRPFTWPQRVANNAKLSDCFKNGWWKGLTEGSTQGFSLQAKFIQILTGQQNIWLEWIEKGLSSILSGLRVMDIFAPQKWQKNLIGYTVFQLKIGLCRDSEKQTRLCANKHLQRIIDKRRIIFWLCHILVKTTPFRCVLSLS